ncbi:MAG: EAL domain-containing protein [Desulfopila sp.]
MEHIITQFDCENLWSTIEELETNAIVVINSDGYIENINKGVTTILGFNKNDVIGERIEVLLLPGVQKLHTGRFNAYVESRNKEVQCRSKLIGVQRIFPDTVTIPGHAPQRFSAVHKNGQEVPISLTINEIWSEYDELIGFLAIISNNTVQFNLHQQLKHQAEYDQVTGLISWPKFVNEVLSIKENSLKNNTDYQASLLFIDIDYFRIISYQSQKASEQAIKKVANWLLLHTRQKAERPRDSVLNYLLGKVFVLYLPNTTLDGAMALARRLKEDFPRLNLRSAKNPFFTTISIGVVEVTSKMKLYDAVSQASHACNRAKKKGKNKIAIADLEKIKYLRLEPIIRKALQREKVELYAQKIVAISPEARAIDGDRAHYEVLSRMQDTQGNPISPAIFVPAAENTGLAFAVDCYVIIRCLSALQRNGDHRRALSLCSINLSAISVANEQLVGFIEEQIDYWGIEPEKLCFEITETSQIYDHKVALELIYRLRQRGCKIALDDFGIGFSNYQSFARLPVDIIKIDGSYIRHMLTNSHLKADVEGMVHSAKSRGIEIVAEYAENKEIIDELQRLGVDYAQGYYYGRPAPLATLIRGEGDGPADRGQI